MRRIHGSQSMPSATGITPDVDAEQRHQAEEGEVGVRGRDRDGDLVRDRPAGRGEQRDLVGLALDPRLLRAGRWRSRAGRSAPSAPVNWTNASLTCAWAIGDRVRAVVADGQLDRCRARARCARRRAPRPAARGARRGRGRRARRTRRSRRRSAAAGRARAARRAAGRCAVRAVAARPSIIAHLEEALPAELGELGLVRVEHELAGVREAPLEDPALALAEHHRVGELRRRLARARREVVEQVPVQVERVDQVVLEHVDEVDPDQLVAARRRSGGPCRRSRSCSRRRPRSRGRSSCRTRSSPSRARRRPRGRPRGRR